MSLISASVSLTVDGITRLRQLQLHNIVLPAVDSMLCCSGVAALTYLSPPLIDSIKASNIRIRVRNSQQPFIRAFSLVIRILDVLHATLIAAVVRLSVVTSDIYATVMAAVGSFRCLMTRIPVKTPLVTLAMSPCHIGNDLQRYSQPTSRSPPQSLQLGGGIQLYAGRRPHRAS